MRAKPEELEFGNFKILRRDNGELWELGRGGFGTTYKAEHTHLMRDCALKVINDSRVASEDARRRFLQEARAAASFQHPHIAAVYDFGESDGTFYYAMEYCAGGDLEKYVEQKGALSWTDVEPLAVQIASALSRAHQSGLLHRDLKPSNVMLASEDQEELQLKLIDFGLVKVLDRDKTSSTQVMMTQEGAAGFNPLTASPEQLRDEDLDERSDLFSFGVTLLYLLCGGVPFGNVSAPLMMAQRLDDESYDSLLPKSLSGVGRDVLSRLLQKDREQRFSSADEVLVAIRTSSSTESMPETSDLDEPSQVVDEMVPVEDIQEVDWASAWEVKQIQQKCHSGAYYRCTGRQQGIPDVVMFLPSRDSAQGETIISYADKLVNSETRMLLSFVDDGYMDGERSYLCQPLMGTGGRLLELLQAQGSFTLQTHLPLYQQMAKAIDEASELGIPGLELNASMILVDEGEVSRGSIPASPDGWLEYYRDKISTDSAFASSVSLVLLPELEDPSDEEDIQATVTLEDLATDPITKYGSLIYRSISGMSVRPAAYLRESGYVSTSNLSEESNRFLSEIIANQSGVSSATEIVEKLCEFEGVTWNTEDLDSHIATRSNASQQFAEQISGVELLLSQTLVSEQAEIREAEERARHEVKKKSEEDRKLEEKKNRELERKKRDDEAKAAADAEKLKLEEEKAAKLEKKKEKRKVESEVAETKRQQEIREKREELERIATEKAKLKEQEVQALAAAKSLKLAEEQEIKEKEKQARKSAEAEKKRKKQAQKLEEEEKRKKATLIKAEAKKKEQAEKDRLKLQEEQRKAEQSKGKAEEEKGKLAEAKKESNRLHKEALHAQKQAEQEKKKVEKERKQLSQQQQGEATGIGSKKKPIVIAAAALILALLVIVGVKSFSGDDGGDSSGSNTSNVTPEDKEDVIKTEPIKDKPKPVPLRSECVVIIPLSDDGKGIPDDVEMELVASDGGGYGALTKSAGVLKATLTEGSPPKGEKFEVKFTNKNYRLESNIKLKSDHFKEVEPGVFRYKLTVPLNVHAQFDIGPSLHPQFAQYQKPLLELLKTRGQLKILNDTDSEIKEAQASYDTSSGKIRIVMPVGRSFDGRNVKLKIDWPYFESLNLEIGSNGLINNKSWEIKLKKYDLNLSILKDRMPRFETVGFIPTFGDGIEPGLKKAIEALLESEKVSYLKNYKDIKGANDVLAVPAQEGSLIFSGGVIQDEGVLIKGAVKRGQLASSFLGFPKGLYVAALPIPFQHHNPPEKGGGYLYTTVPSMVAIHLQDRKEGAPHPFEFRVVIEQGLKMTAYTTTMKLKSWNQRSNQWTLTNVAGTQQALNLVLIVSRSSNGSLSVDYTDIVVNGENEYKFDPLAKSRWGMSIEPKEGGVIHQKRTMKLIRRSENAQLFIQNLERNYALSRKDFRGLKASYQLPSDYPAFTKAIFRKLGE